MKLHSNPFSSQQNKTHELYKHNETFKINVHNLYFLLHIYIYIYIFRASLSRMLLYFLSLERYLFRGCSVIAVAFQSVFRSEMQQNNMFFIFKNYF